MGSGIMVILLALIHLLIIFSGVTNFNMMRRVHGTKIVHSLNNDSAEIISMANLNNTISGSHKPYKTTPMPTIPRRLIFTYKYNLLRPSKDDPPYDETEALTANVLRTIHTYKRHWEHIDRRNIVDGEEVSQDDIDGSELTISFLSNDDCIAVINEAQPKLVRHFNKEKRGDLKADTCRIAELLLHGGYYFDADISVVEPVDLDRLPISSSEDDMISDPSTQLQRMARDGDGMTTQEDEDIITFATVVNVQGVFFQAFLAAMPHHPTIQRALDYILAYYEGTLQHLIPQNVLPKLARYSTTIPSRKQPQGIGLGCYTLAAAYLATNDDEWIQYTKSRLLLENKDGGGHSSAVIEQLQSTIDSKRKKNFSRFLYEISLTSENVTRNNVFRNVPLQSYKKGKFGDGDWCNFVCFGGTKVYFYSRVIGSRGCPKK